MVRRALSIKTDIPPAFYHGGITGVSIINFPTAGQFSETIKFFGQRCVPPAACRCFKKWPIPLGRLGKLQKFFKKVVDEDG